MRSGRPFPPSSLRGALVLALLFLLPAVPAVALPPDPPGARARAAPEWAGPPQPSAPGLPDASRPPPLTPAESERLTGALGDYLDGRGGRLSISLHDLATGADYSYGPEETYVTASLAKLDILVLLLLRADDEGRELSESERELASRMIRYSDNDAADVLYSRIGFDAGFAEGNERLGLRATEPASGVWGATRTTTADQIRLLRAVFTDEGPLSERSRRYARGLLGSVAPEQAWGVSAAAEEGDTVELKNGWVPRESDGNRWVITSAGHVTGAGHEYLIAVLSDQHRDYQAGIECVEHVVTEVAAALGGDHSEDVPPRSGAVDGRP
ncbi:serine hydrolase [Actinorugispora endophytica]|uniref:serine hydrolase n=1 Tax=Actinorugispora endophytica TaxID=1605990 RepID=UPI001FB77F16|nr:serine hydrolase [Actinorugispora endophytica]